jgi:3-dehydroquinate dehydratase II
MQLYIINGPNLNLIGRREPEIYGSLSLEDYLASLRDIFPAHNLHFFQNNHEGALIDKIQEIGFSADGVVLNAGGLTHTSVALADAVAAVPARFVEVHISNVYQRETFRHHSFLSAKCEGSIIGLGLHGYRLALDYLISSNK